MVRRILETAVAETLSKNSTSRRRQQVQASCGLMQTLSDGMVTRLAVGKITLSKSASQRRAHTLNKMTVYIKAG